MSKIDDLILELCPDGVEFVRIGNISTLHRGKSLSKSDVATGDVPIILYGELYTTYGNYITEIFSRCEINRAQLGTRLQVGDLIMPITSTTKEAQIGKASAVLHAAPAYLGGDAIALRHNQEPGYLVHLINGSWFESLKMRHRTGTTVSHLSPQAIMDIEIPLPPLKVQREIVSILDKFTELEAELEAELVARHQQFDCFKRIIMEPSRDWQQKSLHQVAEIFDGPHATPSKTESGPWYLSISSLSNGTLDMTKSAHLAEGDYAKWSKRVSPQIGDTLFSYETRLGEAAHWNIDEPAVLGRRMGLLRPNKSEILPEYLTAMYLSPFFQQQIKDKTVKGSTVDRISIANLGNWTVLIPPFNKQIEIIEQLNQFQEFASGAKAHLPREIIARRQQYEYYRDKLLTFKELEVA